MVENETGCKVQTLCTNRGGEYMSSAFKDFLGKKGIKHQCTMPYTPQQNGVAERKNRSLMEMARCMLKAKSLPHKLWMETVACAAHVLNRCPTHALKTITSYEAWYEKKPLVNYLRVFGCLAYAHIPQQLRGKLDDKAVKCIFVGYNSGSKGYRLYNPTIKKIFESRDVIFAKTLAQPMVAFDVPHMQTQDVFEDSLPSFVENQESQQDNARPVRSRSALALGTRQAGISEYTCRSFSRQPFEWPSDIGWRCEGGHADCIEGCSQTCWKKFEWSNIEPSIKRLQEFLPSDDDKVRESVARALGMVSQFLKADELKAWLNGLLTLGQSPGWAARRGAILATASVLRQAASQVFSSASLRPMVLDITKAQSRDDKVPVRKAAAKALGRLMVYHAK
ncbi:hypothetical protein L7F22_006706 [Adiantum nelumboides]|nr:hypothetical protein [Adiantum nelumboides]